MSPERFLSAALKEWNVAVNALEAGETAVLVRKGGIRERGGRFGVDFNPVLLYPTFEHQKPDWLKPEYRDSVEPVPSGWHPDRVRVGSWAEITDLFSWETSRAETVADALSNFIIWNRTFLGDRLNWKPQKPLHILLLRSYKLLDPVEIPYRDAYGGCRSWIELETAVSIARSSPVLNADEYGELGDRLRDTIRSVSGD
ncbi:DUF1802 family protein [Lyngbya sp. CCY1209]|uniref:DUF1802 family protein n=1 Tax=Lyngbya sp. CCY1209 TaxID=2886103 RepID=UPI002D20BF8E|nr:DUF1802 family protein [Lyngbya sp. CCY1209]MEB3882358.1 DUF1802 family protein [Lyngbya sp. CCY1209]